MPHTQPGMSPWTVSCQSADVVFNYEVANASRRWGCLLSKGFSEVAREEVISQLSPEAQQFFQTPLHRGATLGQPCQKLPWDTKKSKVVNKVFISTRKETEAPGPRDSKE